MKWLRKGEGLKLYFLNSKISVRQFVFVFTLLSGGVIDYNFLFIPLAHATEQRDAVEDLCRFKKLGSVPLQNDGGYLSIPVRIKGQTLRMIVDTGSEGSLISPEVATHLNLSPDQAQRTVIHGTGGGAYKVINMQVPEIQIGEIAFQHVSVPVADLPGKPRLNPPIAGLIGGDILSHLDLDFDVANQRLTFYEVRAISQSCVQPPRWNKPYVMVPLSRIGHRVMLEVKLDGKPVVALLDSGARSRILSTQAANRFGLTPQQLAADPGGVNSGVDGKEGIYHWHKFRSFSIGGNIEKNPVLTVVAMHDMADMLLGADWFAMHKVWVSYATGQLFIAPNMKASYLFHSVKK